MSFADKMATHTIVTGLFDIKRGEWHDFRRSTESYLIYFANVLAMQCPMVIFCEAHFAPLVHCVRQKVPYTTTVIEKTVEDLYMAKYRSLLEEIQADPAYGRDHPDKICPEMSHPLYNLVVCSKLDLLKEGSKLASTDYCIWLDAGYTHAKINLSTIDWRPAAFYAHPQRISLIQLRPLEDAAPEPLAFSNQYIDIIGGACIAGGREIIDHVHGLFYTLVDNLLTKERLKEDDQFYWTLLVREHRELFNLLRGSWFTAITL